MELYHLRSFVTVADEGHLTRAAQRLFTSQPSVSAHIKSLEEELGVTLFSRTSRGMLLTQEGQRLKMHAEKCLSTVNDFFHQARSLQEELVGEAKVSLHTSPELLKIGDFFSIMKARYPNIECHLLQRYSWQVPTQLRDEEIDAGFLYGTLADADMAVTPLRSCKLMIVGPTTWRDDFEYADLDEIVKLPWIGTSKYCPFHQATFETFKQRDLTISRTVAVVDEESTLSISKPLATTPRTSTPIVCCRNSFSVCSSGLLEATASTLGVKSLFTEASITARTFFESRGFKTIRKQEVERRGQPLVNYVMEKTIT